VKIKGGVGEISVSIVEALPTTEPPEYSAAAKRGGLMKKKRKKESSWVKLKDLPTNVGRPNN